MTPAEETAARREEERVFHMWEPLRFETPRGYDYLRDGRAARAGRRALRALVHLILRPLDGLAYGFRIRGGENVRALGDGGAVSVSNHIHPMDCTMADLALRRKRVYYVSLECNFRIPVIRRIVRALGGVPLSADVHGMGELFSAMETAARRGDAVHIYPEGVLVPYGQGLRDFRKGAFRLAVRAGVPVLPMVFLYRAPRGWAARLRRRPYLTLRVLPPMRAPEGLSPREAADALERQVRAAMEAAQAEGA